MKTQYKSIILLCLVFLTVGSMFCMNDILLPTLIKIYKLNYTQATLIQFSFYLTYIIFPLPIAWMIHRYGYKRSLIVALITCFLGCAMFYPAYLNNSYSVVLAAVFILSAGITVLNVAANPFISLLGAPEGAHRRMNFVQVFSRIGYAVTPLFATGLIYGNQTEVRFHYPYLLIAASLIIIAALILSSDMPEMKADKAEKFRISGLVKDCLMYRHLFFGVIAMFFYVGAEACTAGFFIPYMKSVLGFTDSKAAQFLTLYYVFAAIMGFAAVGILKYIKAHKLVSIFGLIMVVEYLICIFLNTGFNEYILAGLGLFLSVMFPTIFSLAIEETGTFAGKGSALLNFALVGGSVFPMIQGALADKMGVGISYAVPCICFMIIALYAAFFTRSSINYRSQTV